MQENERYLSFELQYELTAPISFRLVGLITP